MSTGKLVHGLLSPDATIQGILGNKIFPVQIPQKDAFPAMVYRHLSQDPTLLKDVKSPMDTVTMELTFYTKSYEDSMTLAGRCREILDFFTGTVNTVSVDKIRFLDQNDNDLVEGYGFFVTQQTYTIRLIR